MPMLYEALPQVGSAQAAYAAMTRDMWNQWVSQFIPIENTLIDYSSDVTLPAKNMQRAIEGVRSSFSGIGDLSRRMYPGINLTPEERQAADLQRSLAQAKAEVGAANIARQRTVERQRGILGAPMPAV
jgi:hypothetical protein